MPQVQVYAKLRKESAISAGMPIAVRHLESMIRMSEAHAKMHLRSQVSDADIDTAVRCVRYNIAVRQRGSLIQKGAMTVVLGDCSSPNVQYLSRAS